jgi:hypothetical protein
VAFLLSPEARELRPLLLAELVDGVDLLARSQIRRAYATLPALLAPRLPLLGPLPLPPLPPPPVLVSGVGLMDARRFVEAVAPPLSQPEEVYLQSLSQMGTSMLGARLLLFLAFLEDFCCSTCFILAATGCALAMVEPMLGPAQDILGG